MAEGFVNNWIDNIDNKPIEEREVNESLKVESNENKQTIQLPTDMNEIEIAYNTIYAKINDTEVSLGENIGAIYDKDKNYVEATFGGEWLCLGDGQLLQVTIEEIGEDDAGEFTLYSSPVQVNDKEAKMYVYSSNNQLYIQGIRYLVNEDAHGATFIDVNNSTTITPIYDVWNEEEKTYDTEYGEDYKIKGNDDILLTKLPDGQYSYSIILDDKLGKKIYTQPKTFEMKAGTITYK